MRAYPLISADPLWRKIRKPEPRRFLWRKPEKKNQYASIQLRLTIHPTYPWVKRISSENRTNLDQDFRATKRSALLHTGIGEKWGLSAVSEAVCPGWQARYGQGLNTAPTEGFGATLVPDLSVASRWRPAAGGVRPECNAVATRLQRPESVATGWLPVEHKGAPTCGSRRETWGESDQFFRPYCSTGPASIRLPVVLFEPLGDAGGVVVEDEVVGVEL